MKVCAAEKTALTLSASEKNMVVGEVLTLKAGIAKGIADHRKLQWKSSRSSVASVSRKGFVKAKKKGTAKITVTIKGTAYKAVCTIKVTDIFNESKFTADLNGDGKSENIKVTDFRTGSDAYALLTAYLDGKTSAAKKYSGYYSSACVIGDLSGNGADDVLLLNYDTSSVHGEMEMHVLHFEDGEWIEYPDKFIKNPSIAEEQPDYFNERSADGRKNAWVGAAIRQENGKNYLRCILLDPKDPEFDTVKCIDASCRQDGWYIENVQKVEHYYSDGKEKEILPSLDPKDQMVELIHILFTAFFTGDLDTIKQYADSKEDIELQTYTDKMSADAVPEYMLKGFDEIETIEDEKEYTLWCEFKMRTEDDFFQYLTIRMIKRRNGWKIQSMGLEM